MPKPLQRAPGVIRIEPRLVVRRGESKAAVELVCVVPVRVSGELLADFIVRRSWRAAGERPDRLDRGGFGHCGKALRGRDFQDVVSQAAQPSPDQAFDTNLIAP